MAICEWAKHGTHSPLALFQAARKHAVLANAVATAPRRWWAETARKHGGDYPVLRTPAAMSFALGRDHVDIPAWEVMIFKLSYAAEWRFRSEVRARGGKEGWIFLAQPSLVFMEAARTYGLNCRACGALEDAYQFDEVFLCQRCARMARRYKTPAHFALAVVEKGIAAKAKRERKAA